MTRRDFLLAAAATASFRNQTLDIVANLIAKSACPRQPDDEDFWRQIRQAFVVDPNVINFNNGGVCPSPRVVHDALRRQLEYANQAPSYFMWQHLEPEIESVRARLARVFGVDAEEVAITRNASEALETCLLGLPLEYGDEVLTTTQDYPRMITAIKQRELRNGVKLVQVRVPASPESQAQLVSLIESRITSRTKLILISHVVFLTGQIYPVARMIELGRKRGIPVVVDGAHAFAQFPFQHRDLMCDFYGVSLHKWLMAPIGTGMLYVSKSKIPDIWPLMAANAEQGKDIRKFEEIGTHPAANHNAIAEAITFHEMIGADRKAARLRYLRSRWVKVIQDHPKVVFHTNLNPEHSCALTTVEIKGIEPAKLQEWLFKKHLIWTTAINHEDFQGIRVTPNVYSQIEEVKTFASAMLHAAEKGIE